MKITELKLLSEYPKEDRERIAMQACCFFPELFGSPVRHQYKYYRYLIWLVTDMNIVTGNARDGFSAGGRVVIKLNSGNKIDAPAIFGRVKNYRGLITNTINKSQVQKLKDSWKVEDLKDDRIRQWMELCIPYASQLQWDIEQLELDRIRQRVEQRKLSFESQLKALYELKAKEVFEAIFYPHYTLFYYPT